MLCSCFTLFWIFLLYKILDYLIRIPKRSSPSRVVNNILITGCDSGFGRICALRLDRKGFQIFAACLTEKGKSDIEKASGSVRLKAFIMDVTSTSSIEKGYEFVQRCLPKGEGLWGVVNNAGILQRKLAPAEWLLREDYQECCDVNLFGLVEVTRIFLPLIKKTKGRIVNMASIVGRIGIPGIAAYTVSKFGVEGFSECLRPEVKVFGVSVHIVEPGYHATNFLDLPTLRRFSSEAWERLSPELKEEYSEDFAVKSSAAMVKAVNTFATTNLDKVVDCYEHALLGYFPRGRYLVGKDARLFFWPLSQLPEWFSDWMFNRDPKLPIPKSVRK